MNIVFGVVEHVVWVENGLTYSKWIKVDLIFVNARALQFVTINQLNTFVVRASNL